MAKTTTVQGPGGLTMHFEERFDEWRDGLHRGIGRGLKDGSRHVAAAAAAAETRVKSGALKGSIKAEGRIYNPRSRSGRKLIAVDVVAGDFKAIWHELGTLGRRKRKLVRPKSRKPRAQAAAAGGGGIKPLRFLSKGLRAGMPAVMAAIQRECLRVR